MYKKLQDLTPICVPISHPANFPIRLYCGIRIHRKHTQNSSISTCLLLSEPNTTNSSVCETLKRLFRSPGHMELFLPQITKKRTTTLHPLRDPMDHENKLSSPRGLPFLPEADRDKRTFCPSWFRPWRTYSSHAIAGRRGGKSAANGIRVATPVTTVDPVSTTKSQGNHKPSQPRDAWKLYIKHLVINKKTRTTRNDDHEWLFRWHSVIPCNDLELLRNFKSVMMKLSRPSHKIISVIQNELTKGSRQLRPTK